MTWDIVDSEFVFDTQAINAECNEMSILHFLTEMVLGPFLMVNAMFLWKQSMN